MEGDGIFEKIMGVAYVGIFMVGVPVAGYLELGGCQTCGREKGRG